MVYHGFLRVARRAVRVAFTYIPELDFDGDYSRVSMYAACGVAIALFAAYIVYEAVLLVKYYREPKELVYREDDRIRFFAQKEGWVAVPVREIGYAGVSGSLMKSSMIQLLFHTADGDLLLTAAGKQYKVLNVRKTAEVRDAISDLAARARSSSAEFQAAAE